VRLFYEDKKGSLWIGTENGLFRKEPQAAEPRLVVHVADVSAFYEDKKGNLWIGTENGLFRLEGPNGEWEARVELTGNVPNLIFKDTPLVIVWKISNYGWRATSDTVRCCVVFFDKEGKEVKGGRFDVPQQRFDFTFDPVKHCYLSPGNYSFQVEATNLHGQMVRSPEYHFVVQSSYEEAVLGWLKKIGVWSAVIYGSINIVVFVVLVIGARWSRHCFEILTDPVVRKGGIYFGFALHHFRFVRLWVFARYFQQVKAELRTDHDYVDRPVRRIDGSEFPTSHLFDEFKTRSHIWLTGGPGTGKTEMVAMLMRTYFGEPSLRAAWKRFRFILIAVPLRAVPGKTVVDIVTEVLQNNEMPFDDAKYFKRLFPSAEFLLLLDGFNEVALDDVAVLAVPSSVRMLITSQTRPVTSQTRPQQTTGTLETLELLPINPDFGKQLLISFILEGEKGEEVEERAKQACERVAKNLWEEIESGYDVRLIADLLSRGRPLPTNALKLYESLFDDGASSDSQHIVCQFAWECWKAGQRRFKADDRVTPDLLTPLQDASIVVVRGKEFEFRHDLMRGYLAACWVVKHAVSVQVTVERLQEKEIWILSPSDQEAVFPFLSRLVEKKDDLTAIANFAAREPRVRVMLLESAQAAARKKRWGNLTITLAAQDDGEGPGT
jgi:hypothetical protein